MTTPPNPTESEPLPSSGIKVIEARIANFHSLRNVIVKLGDMTLLVGENNAGKTSFLEALAVAIGDGRRSPTREDIYVSSDENSVPRERQAVIDLLIRPVDASGAILDSFPQGSFWLELWGNGIHLDQDNRDYVGIRTIIAWDTTRNEYSIRRHFLQDWLPDDRWSEARVLSGVFVQGAQIEPLALHFLDAQRDLQQELSNRGSYWHRLISDPELSPELVAKLEETLTQLNKDIISGAPVLDHVGRSLGDIYRTIGSDPASVSITPLPRHLRDLSRGMDVQFATQGGPTLPLSRHGMGTRSLAAILVFRAYCTWRMQAAGAANIHPILALEEPEAHLHPQAQRAMVRQIQSMPGQRIVSSHSPFVAAQTGIDDLRLFRKQGAETVVTAVTDASWTADEKEKVDRKVMATRGELLFARAVVYVSGETEEFAIPVFAEERWGDLPAALGVNFVSVSGDGQFTPFLRLANALSIPWFVLSDGEPKAVADVERALQQVGETIPSPRVFTIPDAQNIETFLATLYPDELRDAIVGKLCEDATSEQHREAIKEHWRTIDDIPGSVAKEMERLKVTYGKIAAATIVGVADEQRKIPGLIRDLFSAVEQGCGIIPK